MTTKRGGEPLTEEDFRPVPSVDGAYYHPVEYGRIVYKQERDAILKKPSRLKRLLRLS